jgi:hypothetical protein
MINLPSCVFIILCLVVTSVTAQCPENNGSWQPIRAALRTRATLMLGAEVPLLTMARVSFVFARLDTRTMATVAARVRSFNDTPDRLFLITSCRQRRVPTRCVWREYCLHQAPRHLQLHVQGWL